jgi:hypothetical protein
MVVIAYQIVRQTRAAVECEFKLDRNKVSFELGEYDPTLPLLIDPVLIYSTCFGSSGPELVKAMAVDASGDVFLTGRTGSPDDFPFHNAYPAQPAHSCFIFRANLRLQLLDLGLQFRYLARRGHPKNEPHHPEYETKYAECIHIFIFFFRVPNDQARRQPPERAGEAPITRVSRPESAAAVRRSARVRRHCCLSFLI